MHGSIWGKTRGTKRWHPCSGNSILGEGTYEDMKKIPGSGNTETKKNNLALEKLTFSQIIKNRSMNLI